MTVLPLALGNSLYKNEVYVKLDAVIVKEQTEFINFKVHRFISQYFTEIVIAAQE